MDITDFCNVATVAPSTKLTREAYWARFLPAEQSAYFAALPADANIQALNQSMNFASFVDLADPRTAAGLNYLSANPSAAPVLTADRAQAILSTPPMQSEVYTGS